MANKSEPLPIWRQQSPIDLSVDNSLPTAFPLDYLVIKYPDDEVRGRFEDENFWFDSKPPIVFNGSEG
jgi:hypothetical protein